MEQTQAIETTRFRLVAATAAHVSAEINDRDALLD